MESPESFERLRRSLSWLAVSVFIVCFVALLGLSGTAYWMPQDRWVSSIDRLLRLSGGIALGLWLIPYALRALGWIAAVFSGNR